MDDFERKTASSNDYNRTIKKGSLNNNLTSRTDRTKVGHEINALKNNTFRGADEMIDRL